MRLSLMTAVVMASCAVFAQDVMPKTVSPYAPSQIIPASEKTVRKPLVEVREVKEKAGRRARPPRERRLEGRIPGLVTIPYGKTASGKRTYIYRIMGQGGMVADFTDYGARLLRVYAPDATGDLANVLAGFKPSVVACEKAGDIAEVWKMTPIRRPRATGLRFELGSATNTPAVVYWVDAQNRLSVESANIGTNAVKWASSIKLLPLAGRSVEVKTPSGTSCYQTTTNETLVVFRPATNDIQKVELNFGIKKGM